MDKYLPQGYCFLFKQISGLFQLKKKKKRYCGKYEKIQEFHVNLCFYFLISEPLHLEIKVLLGFDLESSEVKGRFPL